MQQPYPILEYDSTREAVIEPKRAIEPLAAMPEKVVLCFFYEVVNALCKDAEVVNVRMSEMGPNPVYALETEFGRVGVMQPGVGAPLAGGFLDEIIALGAKQVIACGGAGVLDSDIPPGHLIVPTAAVRDEGTSYHYLPPGREVAPSPGAVDAIKATLERHSIPYHTGKTWTTDAIFRETPEKVKLRRNEGCLSVEMEAAAFFAIAQFRGITFGQILYGGDDVSGSDWDHRNWIHGNAGTREKLFWLAAEAVSRL
ncbi:MAG: nucleoside phosphorylase [Chloroflexota bacterium]